MLASIGAFSAQFGLVIPGYTANPDPVTNLNEFVVNYPLGFAQFWFGKGEREAGDLGYDPLGFFKNKTQAQKDTLRLQELKNGRLAMIALA
eukprot:gene1884-2220_t